MTRSEYTEAFYKCSLEGMAEGQMLYIEELQVGTDIKIFSYTGNWLLNSEVIGLRLICHQAVFWQQLDVQWPIGHGHGTIQEPPLLYIVIWSIDEFGSSRDSSPTTHLLKMSHFALLLY